VEKNIFRAHINIKIPLRDLIITFCISFITHLLYLDATEDIFRTLNPKDLEKIKAIFIAVSILKKMANMP